MRYQLDSFPLIESLPKAITIIVSAPTKVENSFSFVNGGPAFQYIVEENSVLDLGFQLVNTLNNDFLLDQQSLGSADPFTALTTDMKSGRGQINFLISPLAGDKGSYMISFTATEILEKFTVLLLRAKRTHSCFR